MKFRQVYESVLLGDALIVYSRKLEEKNRSGSEKFKIELMKLEILGKMITGEDIKLIDKFEESTGKKEKKVNQGALVKAGFDII